MADMETRGWMPIETAQKDGTAVLVYGRKWVGGWDQSPHDAKRPGSFTGDLEIAIARTYEGASFWTILGGCAPPEYDDYIQPTHWMPLPIPPDDTGNG